MKSVMGSLGESTEHQEEEISEAWRFDHVGDQEEQVSKSTWNILLNEKEECNEVSVTEETGQVGWRLRT